MKKRKKKSAPVTQEQIRYLEEHYPDTPNEVLAEQLDLSPYTIRAKVTKYGWRKSKEYISRQRTQIARDNKFYDRLNLPENLKKRGEAIRRRYQDERERIRAGLPQKTRYLVRTVSLKQANQRFYLKSRGYIINDDIRVAYYTPETKRCPRIERIARDTTRGVIHSFYDFWPLPDKG